MSHDLIIFDCDGVLVDSEVIAVEIDRRILAEFGWHLSIDEIVDRFLGGTEEAFVAQLGAHLGRPLPPDWDAPYVAWYREAFEAELQPVLGIESVLSGIDAPFCVASNGSHAKIRHSLGLTGLLEHFPDEHIFSAQDVAHGKPAPDLFRHAARSLGAAPEDCVVIEDSRSGVRAARAAGMRVLGYAGGLTPAAWLADEGATVFTDMTEVPALLA
ncbi:HAD family hydrolase [Microbacterium gorillae]|uniref:HAD family hydrolase n=1 Tax=Microbacterium gorillae TaxID=1231063 RepID=UPI00058D27E8|nr:HAD family hydrolase [Microbacterium gorillae]